MRSFRLAFLLALPLALTSLVTAVPAASAQARDWQPITGHESMVLATCSDGSQVISADLSDPRRNRYVMEPILDQDGNVTGMLLMLKYAGYFAHSVSDELIWGSGTDRIVMDFVTGTETHTGNRWNVAIEAEGWVVKEAGQITLDMTDGSVLDITGLNETGWERLCPFFGVTG